MRKMRISILILLIIAAIAYSSVWFLSATATKNNILATLKYLKSEQNLDIAYESISLGGFPYKIKVFIKKPIISMYKNSLEVATINMPKLIIVSNLIGTTYEFLDANDIKIDLKGAKYTLDYNSSPLLKIKFYHSPLFSQLASGASHKWWHNLESIDYSDQGYKVADYVNKLIYESSNNLFGMTHNLSSKTNIIDVKLETQDINSLVSDIPTKFNFVTEIGVEITNDEPQENANAAYPYEAIKLNLKNYNLVGNDFIIKSSGHFQSSKEELIPVGKLDININNYNHFLDYICSALKIENKEKFTKLVVEKIATISKDDLLVTIERQANEMLHIGKMTMPEIVTYYLGGNTQ